MGKQTKTITRVSQVTGTTRLRKLFFSFGNLILIFLDAVFFFVSETFNSQMMMKLILILGLLVATANCGTEHRRAARAETARSEMMSREAGVVNSDSAPQRDLETLESGNNKTRESAGAGAGADSNSRQSFLPKECFYGRRFPCKWSDTKQLRVSYGCDKGHCWHQCIFMDTSHGRCLSSKDNIGGFYNTDYLYCSAHEDCKRQKAFNGGCAGSCTREI